MEKLFYGTVKAGYVKYNYWYTWKKINDARCIIEICHISIQNKL